MHEVSNVRHSGHGKMFAASRVMGQTSVPAVLHQLVTLWMPLVTFWVALVSFNLPRTAQAKQTLYIGGFFPLENNNWNADGLIPAAQMAIEDINNRSDLLADYELRMEWNNTKCDTGVGMAALFDQLNQIPQKIMLLGAGCTLVTGPMAETAQYWNLVQISHTSSSPSLNNRNKYPLLFRMYPSEETMNHPRLALMREFGWNQAALLYSTQGSFSDVIAHMRDLLIDHGMDPLLSESFSGDPTAALKNIKVKEARIIIANMFESTARQAFCKAHGLGMIGPSYVWIIPGWFTDQWWLENDTTCTQSEMTEAVTGYISMETQAVGSNTKVTDGGRTPAEFLRDYTVMVSQTSFSPHDLAAFAYDSVFTIAIALNSSIEHLQPMGVRLEDFEYTNADMAKVFFSMVNITDFSGITGPISFDVNGKRLGYTRIEQLQNGAEVQMALFDDSALEFINLNKSSFLWSTDDGEPPPDGVLVVEEWRTVSLPLMIAMTTISVAGMVFVLLLLTINIVYRERRILRLSSPNLNYVICIGSLFMYDYVIFLGLDSTLLNLQNRPSTFFSATCLVKQWLLPLSFSLSFGAIFAKAWRIHRIFSNSKMKKRTIKDSQLLIIVSVLLVLDAILLVTWDVLDRPIGGNISLPQQTRGLDVVVHPYVEHCYCRQENVWLGVFFGYKGLLLLYGAFLAWENRVVKIDVLSDARNIGITIYTTVVLCCVVAPVSVVFTDEIDFAYASLAGSINFATTVMLSLCFLPKIHILFTNSVSTENILIANMMTLTQRQGEQRTEDRLIADLKQKIIELEASNLKLKQELKKDSPKPDQRRRNDLSSCSLVRYSRPKGGQLELETISDTVGSPEQGGRAGANSQSHKTEHSST